MQIDEKELRKAWEECSSIKDVAKRFGVAESQIWYRAGKLDLDPDAMGIGSVVSVTYGGTKEDREAKSYPQIHISRKVTDKLMQHFNNSESYRFKYQAIQGPIKKFIVEFLPADTSKKFDIPEKQAVFIESANMPQGMNPQSKADTLQAMRER